MPRDKFPVYHQDLEGLDPEVPAMDTLQLMGGFIWEGLYFSEKK